MKKIFCIALIACLLLALTACGVSGHYTIKEVSYGGISVSAKDAGLDTDDNYIDMKANGTAVLCMDGDETDMKWKDGQIWAEGEEDDKADFEVDHNELIIELDEMEMVFEKD